MEGMCIHSFQSFKDYYYATFVTATTANNTHTSIGIPCPVHVKKYLIPVHRYKLLKSKPPENTITRKCHYKKHHSTIVTSILQLCFT